MIDTEFAVLDAWQDEILTFPFTTVSSEVNNVLLNRCYYDICEPLMSMLSAPRQHSLWLTLLLEGLMMSHPSKSSRHLRSFLTLSARSVGGEVILL